MIGRMPPNSSMYQAVFPVFRVSGVKIACNIRLWLACRIAPVHRLPDFHDRSLSRGQKLSRRAAEERGYNFFSVDACAGLSAVVPIGYRTRLPFAVSARERAAQKIEFVFSCQSRNLSKGASGACAPWPSRLTARPGRPHAEKIQSLSPRLTQRSGFLFLLPGSLFPGDRQQPSRPRASALQPVSRD
jgi:hypothetical protein